MPDTSLLKIGDRIRINSVPLADLKQREHEVETNAEMAGWTADSIERIIEQTPIVQISRIDEYGCVWYDATLTGEDGCEEIHSLLVYDDDTWELVDDGN